jgi:hypothetical protein
MALQGRFLASFCVESKGYKRNKKAIFENKLLVIADFLVVSDRIAPEFWEER